MVLSVQLLEAISLSTRGQPMAHGFADGTLGLAAAVEAARFDYVLTVPCSVLSRWYSPSRRLPTIYLSREEEGVGIGVGLLAAGRQPLLLIQNSGLGNCLNALGSLAVAYEVPMVVAVSLRGDDMDDNPVQKPMGEATAAFIEALGCRSTLVVKASKVESMLVTARIRANRARRPEFLLLPRPEAIC